MNFKQFNQDIENLNVIELNENDLNKIKNYSNIKIKKYFPKLEKKLSDKLLNGVSYLLYHLLIGLNIESEIDKSQVFLEQISLNDDRNFLEVFYSFFPFISDSNNFENQKKIKNMKQVFNSLKGNTEKLEYEFTNFTHDHRKVKDVKHSMELIDGNSINAKKLEIYMDESDYELDIDNLFFQLLNSYNSIRYKLYVNWLNVFPINLNNYKSKKLYKNSFKLDSNNKFTFNGIYLTYFNVMWSFPTSFEIKEFAQEFNVDINEVIDTIESSFKLPLIYSGINVEDIYNTFSNDFYYGVKRNKWLIFEISKKSENILLISCLDELLDLENIVNGKQYNLLKESEKGKFSKKWEKLVDSVRKGISLKSYSLNSLIKILTYIVSYFEFHYDEIRGLIKKNEYKKLPGGKKNEDIDDEEINFEDNNITFKKEAPFTISDVLESINDTPSEHIYNFILNEINEIKQTVYNNMLFDENKILRDLKYDRFEDERYIVTPKNYYNFGKSLVYFRNNKMNNLWDGLSRKERFAVVFKLNSVEDSQNWFRISNILKMYGYSDINGLTNIIYKKIRSNLIDITFENLIRKGCISIFEVNPSVTDFKILTNDYNTKKINLEKNLVNIFTKERVKEYEKAYYYATNEQYKELDKLIIKNDKKTKTLNDIDHDSEEIRLSYLQYLKRPTITNDIWFTFYAMDWACQMNFFTKMINKRVTFLTGGTGAGKSTQAPKLYLYGLKSLLYKNNAKILCTAPRIGPVLENAKSISKSMGLPIEMYNGMFKERIRTLNSVVQYQYANDKHVNNSNFYLRIITDGILVQLLKQNIMLKHKISSKNENKFSPKSFYNDRNVCDLVIIDEAHEHNKNMDIILTMMKYTMFYNNDIKLSIISATMDDDEPIFRKFYRVINDNLMYPISTFNLECRLDRNLLDRRFHISPPGLQTQYKIDEYYEDMSEDTYEKNEELAIKRIVKLFTSTDNGDILTFSTTQKKIYELANKLNKVIPGDCICIPYYGKLSQKYQEIAKEAASKIKEIEIDRDDLLLLFENKKDEKDCKKVQKGTYTRCCIIATNAAEASLTITSLKYVVDIGFQLRTRYSYDTSEVEIEDNSPITEASRLQRKGRVGRVMDGTAYYMYPKGSREKTKIEYSISTENFSDTFKDLLATDVTDDSEIIPFVCIKKLLSLEKLNNDDLRKLNSNSRLIYNQYKLADKFYDSSNLCMFLDQSDNLIFKELQYYFPSYTTGFSDTTLLDISGHFYIIHPLESSYKRDFMTLNFVDSNNKFKPIDESITKIVEDSVIRQDIILIEYSYFKNSITLEFDDINTKLKSYDLNYLKLFSYSLILNNFDSEDGNLSKIVNFIYTLLEEINFNYDNLILPEKKELFFKTNKVYSSSDLEYFYNLFKDITSIVKFDKLVNFEEKKVVNISDNLVNFLSEKNNITTSLINKFCKKMNLSPNIHKELTKLILKGDLSLNSIKEEGLHIEGKKTMKNILEEDSNIKRYCEESYLNYEIICSFLSKFLKNYSKFDKSYLTDQFSGNISNLSDMVILNKNNSNLENLIYCFSLTYFPNTFYSKNDNTYKYIKSHKITVGPNLLKNISDLAFYIRLDKNVSFITNIKKDTLIDVGYLLIMYQTLENEKFYNFEDIKQNVNILTKKITNFSYDNKNVVVDNITTEDKNFLNILMKQIIESPETLVQSGGNLEYIGKVSKKLLKSTKIFNLLKKKNIDLDSYNYAYVNLKESKLKGFNLIRETDDISSVKIVINNDYLNNYTKTRLLNRGQKILIS